MKIMSGAKYGKIMTETAEAGILTGFTGATVLLLGGVAVAGVTKNVATLVRNRIADKKAAKATVTFTIKEENTTE